MSDIIDRANERAEQDLERSIAAARNSNGLQVAAVGYCLNCGPDTPLPDGLRWCSPDCRDDWQKANPNV